MLLTSSTTRLVFLGTGTPNPDPHHLGPSAAVIVNGQPYLVDCGAGCVRQAAAAGLTMDRLTHLFLTHLHSDHTIGLPDVVLTPAVTGRQGPLSLWGPAGTRRMTELVLEAWSQDVRTRLHGGEPSLAAAYGVEVAEFAAGPVYEDENARVSGFEVQHGSWENAFGLRFETPDRVIVFSGDTTYCPNLIEHARGSDVLVHEVYSSKGLAARTPEWQAYHSTFHTSSFEVGKIAKEVKPKLLILYHVLPFGRPEEEVAEEVRSVWDGDVRLAQDLEVY